MNIIEIILVSLVICAPILFSFLIILKSLYKFPSKFILELSLASVCILLWTIIIIPINLYPDHFALMEISYFDTLSAFFGGLAIIIFAFIIGNAFPTNLLTLPRILIAVASFILGILLVQLFLPTSSIIQGLRLENGELIKTSNFYISLAIYFQYLILGFVGILYILFQIKLPEEFKPKNLKILLYTALCFGVLGLVSDAIGDELSSSFFRIIARVFTSTSFMLLIIQFLRDPILTFREGGNPLPFIEKGLFGFLLAGKREFGPETIISSNRFKQKFEIQDLNMLSMRLITSVGLGEKTFSEDLITIPFQTEEYSFTSIGFSFTFPDSNLKIQKQSNKVDLLFAVIIPSYLTHFLENLTLDGIKDPVYEFLENFSDLETIIYSTRLNNLANDVIRGLAIRKISYI